MASQYQAGKCNIGLEEINYRRRIVGYGSGFITLTLYFMLVYFNFPVLLYLFILIPVFVSVHGISEARSKFCTSYARGGKYNMNGEVGMTQSVIGGSKRSQDKKYADVLIKQSLIRAAVITAVLIAASRLIN